MRRDRSVFLLHHEPSPVEPSRWCVRLAAQESTRRTLRPLPCPAGRCGHSTRDATKPERLNGTTGTTRAQPAARTPAGFTSPVRSRRPIQATVGTSQDRRWCTAHRAGESAVVHGAPRRRAGLGTWCCTAHRAGSRPRELGGVRRTAPESRSPRSSVVHGAPRRRAGPKITDGARRTAPGARPQGRRWCTAHRAGEQYPEIAGGARCTAPRLMVHGAPRR